MPCWLVSSCKHFEGIMSLQNIGDYVPFDMLGNSRRHASSSLNLVWIFVHFYIFLLPLASLMYQCKYSLKNLISYSLPFSTRKMFTVTCSWLYFPVGIQCEKRYFQMEFYLTLVSNRRSAQIRHSSLARQQMPLELMTLASTWSFRVRK